MDGNLQDDDLLSILSWDEHTSHGDAFDTDDDEDDMHNLTYSFERDEEQVDEMMAMNQDRVRMVQQFSNFKAHDDPSHTHVSDDEDVFQCATRISKMDGHLQDDDLLSIFSGVDEDDMQHLTCKFERDEEKVDEMTMNQDQAKIIQQVSNVSPLSVQDLKLHTRLFPFKLYDLLDVVGDLEKGSASVSWTRDGNAFIIHNRDSFMKYVAPMFFNQSKFLSFTRQLRRWGFQHVKYDDSPNFGAWYNEKFIRGQKDELKNITMLVEINRTPKIISRQPSRSSPSFVIKNTKAPSDHMHRISNQVLKSIGEESRIQVHGSSSLATKNNAEAGGNYAIIQTGQRNTINIQHIMVTNREHQTNLFNLNKQGSHRSSHQVFTKSPTTSTTHVLMSDEYAQPESLVLVPPPFKACDDPSPTHVLSDKEDIFQRSTRIYKMDGNLHDARMLQPVSNVSPLSVQDLKLHTRLFPFKLYDLLDVVGDLEKGSASVSWTRDGNAFIIHNRDSFMKYVAPMFFNQSKFLSFTRQLRRWGFQHVKYDDSPNFGAWHNEKFIRGQKDELKNITLAGINRTPKVISRQPSRSSP